MSEKRINILGWLTLIAVLAAIWVMFGEGLQTSSIGRGHPLFAGLADKIEQTRKVELTKNGETITLVANGSDWSIVERSGYSADASKVRALLRSLVLSERREPKTGNSARLERIGLGDGAMHVNVFDGDGNSLAGLMIGKQRTGADGHSHAYILIDGEPKSWLVSAVTALDLEIASWIDNQIIAINQERIKKINFDLKEGTDYALVRETQGANFGLNDVKAGEKAVEGYSLNEAASMMSTLAFEDVATATGGGIAHTVVTVSTFDGLVITVTIESHGDAFWMTTRAVYDVTVAEEGTAGVINGAPADGKLEADLYNDRHKGWQYRLKADDVQAQTMSRDVYLDKDADTP